jgi:hypothetical protein
VIDFDIVLKHEFSYSKRLHEARCYSTGCKSDSTVDNKTAEMREQLRSASSDMKSIMYSSLQLERDIDSLKQLILTAGLALLCCKHAVCASD